MLHVKVFGEEKEFLITEYDRGSYVW